MDNPKASAQQRWRHHHFHTFSWPCLMSSQNDWLGMLLFKRPYRLLEASGEHILLPFLVTCFSNYINWLSPTDDIQSLEKKESMIWPWTLCRSRLSLGKTMYRHILLTGDFSQNSRKTPEIAERQGMYSLERLLSSAHLSAWWPLCIRYFRCTIVVMATQELENSTADVLNERYPWGSSAKIHQYPDNTRRK